MAIKSRAEIAAAAASEGLDAERLAAVARPALSLRLTRGPGPIGETKVGGWPDLAEDEEWPRNQAGVPMMFVAQLATAHLPDLEPADQVWDHRGELVRLFADLIDNPYDPGPAIGLATGAADLRSTPPPDSGPIDDDAVRELPECLVVSAPVMTVPGVHPAVGDEDDPWSHPLQDDYDTFLDSIGYHEVESPHQILGWPTQVQADPPHTGPYVEEIHNPRQEPTRAADWRLLLQLHDDDSVGLEILDGGSYAFLMPAVDLAAGRYSRLACDVDSC